jgi:hypothetical protein
MRRNLIVWLALIFGLLATLGGLALLALALYIAVRGGTLAGSLPAASAGVLPAEVVVGSAALLSLGFGLCLVWAGWRTLSGTTSGRLRLGGWVWWLLALGLILAAGQWAFLSAPGPWLILPQVLAGLAPALFFLSLALWAAGRRRQWLGRRGALASMSWGALAAPAVASVLETVLAVFLVVLVLAWFQATDPGALAGLRDWARSIPGRGGELPDLGPIFPLVTLPATILGLLALMSVGAPLIEESVKSAVVPIAALAGAPLTRLDGFLLGLASGAGFAVLEGTFYGAFAISTPAGWAGVMALRAGTTAMHCFASGLAGLGWQVALAERRWLRGLLLGLGAVALHGTWNGLALAQVLLSLASSTFGVAGSLALIALTGLFGLLLLGALIGIPLVAGRVAATPSMVPTMLPAIPTDGRAQDEAAQAGAGLPDAGEVAADRMPSDGEESVIQ